jgi:hypothetical protein
MRIDEILANQPTADVGRSAALISLEGDIQPDHNAEQFRLYPKKSNRQNIYYLIPKSALSDIYKFTPEELVAGGFVGQSRYRVLLSYGTLVQLVSVTHHRVGEGKRRTTSTTSKRKESQQDCECQGPDDGCPDDDPCADSCGNCSNCCIA